MKRFLLHICCAPCAAYVIQELRNRAFDVTAFFYNPNIYPEKEYEIRRDEIKKYCKENNIDFIEGDYSYKGWRENLGRDEAMPRLYTEPEGGKRCEVCYKIRLEKTGEYAAQHDYEYFGTTLSISPYKKAEIINRIGQELAKKYKIKFYAEDWKKQDGFKKSCQLSHEYKFYRQDYCGCEFSMV